MSSQACYPDKAPTIDALLETLAHHVRREVINYFENCVETRTATFDELVDHVDGRVPSPARERLAIELAHNHLPKLADHHWIDYDAASGHVRYTGRDDAERLLGEVRAVF